MARRIYRIKKVVGDGYDPYYYIEYKDCCDFWWWNPIEKDSYDCPDTPVSDARLFLKTFSSKSKALAYIDKLKKQELKAAKRKERSSVVYTESLLARLLLVLKRLFRHKETV